jgi:hypothetical protein
MMLKNLTPYDITLLSPEGAASVIPASGVVARVTMVPGDACWSVVGIPCPVYEADRHGMVTGLPLPEEGVMYLVSGMVGAAIASRNRQDVLVPGTGPDDGAVRNEKGHIVAITRLKRV